MQVFFEKIGLKYRKIIKKVVDMALQITDNDLPQAVISYTFMNEKEMQKLNLKSRNVDRVTDVLSFPMIEIKQGEKLQDYLNELSPDGNLYIGDVVICPRKAKTQAKEYGHSLRREVAFLALHGLLHILGYDHIKEGDECVMQDTANKVLNALGIRRK